MPATFACLMNAGEGGKTRFSCKTDSILADMASPRISWLIGAPNQQPVKAPGRRAVLQWRAFLAARKYDDHPPRGPRAERRRRTAIYFLLPPRRLHPRPRPRLRARAIGRGEGRHRPDPHQFAHVRGRPPP